MAELSRQLRRWKELLKSWVKQGFPQASRVLLQLWVSVIKSLPHPLGCSCLLEGDEMS